MITKKPAIINSWKTTPHGENKCGKRRAAHHSYLSTPREVGEEGGDPEEEVAAGLLAEEAAAGHPEEEVARHRLPKHKSWVPPKTRVGVAVLTLGETSIAHLTPYHRRRRHRRQAGLAGTGDRPEEAAVPGDPGEGQGAVCHHLAAQVDRLAVGEQGDRAPDDHRLAEAAQVGRQETVGHQVEAVPGVQATVDRRAAGEQGVQPVVPAQAAQVEAQGDRHQVAEEVPARPHRREVRGMGA